MIAASLADDDLLLLLDQPRAHASVSREARAHQFHQQPGMIVYDDRFV